MLIKRYMHNNKAWALILIIGLASMLFGIIGVLGLDEEQHSLNMLMGMLTGFGFALAAVSIVCLIRNKIMSPEKRRLAEIALSDERKQLINGKVGYFNILVCTLLFVVMAFLFVAMNLRPAAYICIGAMYVELISVVLAGIYFDKKY